MKPALTLGTYAAALALVFGAAVGVGNAVGPVGTAGSEPAAHAGDHAAGAVHTEAPSRGTAAGLEAGGLAVSQEGYTLRLAQDTAAVGAPSELSFTISGPDGRPVTDYIPSHDRDLHLIVARRDLTGFQHVHPSRDAAGTWSVPLAFAQPGPYKVFADFVPTGRDRALTLAADLTVPGDYAPTPLPADTSVTSVDGYDVALAGQLVAGTSSRLTLTVSKDGRPVTDLQPYLGAYGHLVALRDGDLAYLHVHPEGDLADPQTRPGPDVVFYADVPAAATYRLFLDFQHAGTVRTAALTATAVRPGETTPIGGGTEPAPHGSEPHGH